MGLVTIQNYTTKTPIQMIGREAGICWGADTTDPDKNYRRGLNCFESEHGRTFEYPDIYMIIEGYSARVIREYYTHIGGLPTRLQASTRRIEYGDFDYVVPPSVKDDLKVNYDKTMAVIQQTIKDLEKAGVPREDCAMLLPLGMETTIVDKRNLRNLIDMSRQRMCNRAYWEYRELFHDICDALRNYSDEWKDVVDTQMMPKCKVVGYCKENNSCGMMPKKK